MSSVRFPSATAAVISVAAALVASRPSIRGTSGGDGLGERLAVIKPRFYRRCMHFVLTAEDVVRRVGQARQQVVLQRHELQLVALWVCVCKERGLGMCLCIIFE